MGSAKGRAITLFIMLLTLSLGVCIGWYFASGHYYDEGYHDGVQASDQDAYDSGFQEGNETGYELGYDVGVGDAPKIVNLNPGEKVSDLRGFQVGSYNIDLRKAENDPYLEPYFVDSPDKVQQVVSGYAWENGSIVIQSNLPVDVFERVCTHEILHVEYPEKEHPEDNDWFQEMERSTKFEECQELLTMVKTEDPGLNIIVR
jgi:hypothetical protein